MQVAQRAEPAQRKGGLARSCSLAANVPAGARRLLPMASAVVTLIVKEGRSAISDVARLDLLPHLNEEVVDTVCVDRAPLNTTSVIVPLVDRCHRSGWLPIRSGRTRVRISTRLGGGACRCLTPPSIHVLIGPLIFHRGALPHRINGRTSPQNNRPRRRLRIAHTDSRSHGPTVIGPSDSNRDLFRCEPGSVRRGSQRLSVGPVRRRALSSAL